MTTPMTAAASTVGKSTVRGPVSGFVWALIVQWVLVDRLGWLDANDGASQAVIFLIATFIVLVLRALERRWPAFGWGLLAAGAPEGYQPSPGSRSPIDVDSRPAVPSGAVPIPPGVDTGPAFSTIANQPPPIPPGAPAAEAPDDDLLEGH